jgi:uncharacterized repeat protein (TIGR02543 family)
LLLLLLLTALLGCAACAGGDQSHAAGTQDSADIICHVSFHNGDGSVSVLTVNQGERVSYLDLPDRDNEVFMGWYLDKTFTERYDFSAPVYDSFSLYARFSVDYESLTNTLTTETMRGIVTVNVAQYKPKKFLGFIDMGRDNDTRKGSQGSGVVFAITEDYALILTNCHVAINYSGYSYYDCTVTDYRGREFKAVQYHSISKPEAAIDPDYDLAVLYVELKGVKHEFLKIEQASEDAELGETVAAVSTPKGQQNAIRYGHVTGYNQITLENCTAEESNVTFPVMTIDAYTLPGSSGGAVLDTKCRIIGIHYAGGQNDAYRGYAIPITKVREFLDRYVYN